MNDLFWKNKKVLLTGHTGFKGSWLALWLQTMGANVIGYSLPPTSNPNLFELAFSEKEINSTIGDIRNFDALYHVVKHEKPDIVFHLAAQALVRHSYLKPIETYSTNVMGTVNLLEALRQVACARAIIIVTSDKCYENREWVWGYRETEPMGGYDPYSSSKGCAELVTAAYRYSYFAQPNEQTVFLASARAGNVIGGGDWSTDRLIPDFFRAMMSNHPFKVRNPLAIRPWQHVLESLSGYLMLAECLWTEGEAFSGSWNFGPDEQDTKTVEWVANTLTQLWGEGSRWELDQGSHLHEARYLKLDTSKARFKLKWKPQWPLEKALSSTIEWHKAYCRGLNVKEIMLKQIAEYRLSRQS